MSHLESLKANYAKLIIKKGLNIQKGQRLCIRCPIERADFGRLCAKEAYDAGCKEVIMMWEDDETDRIKFLNADDSVFDCVNEWEKLQRDIMCEEGCAWLAIYAEDPEKYKDVPQDRLTRYQIATGKAFENFYRHETKNDFQWCVVSVPVARWAQTVFPELTAIEAEERLWMEILKACHADGDDPIAAWEKHSNELHDRVDRLNAYNFKTLHYTNSRGTDFTVDLPENHYWAGGEEESTKGIMFSANIPSEEVFTLPHNRSLNGKIVATRPFSTNGNIVDGFYFIVKDGKIIEVHAEKNEQILKDAISVDEGASYFGELALVPYDSPISNSGILFFNTLFDENASCHLAFGEAYPCIKGSEKMSDDELKALGVNYSMTHEDFMIGSEDLSIVGITHDGKEVTIFKDGNFAF